MHYDMQWYDWLRIVNAAMCAFVGYKEGRRFIRLHDDFSSRLRDLWWVYLACMFLIFYGSLEAVVLNAEGGPRNALAFFVSVIAFRAALRKAPVDVENDHGAT